MQIRNFTKYKVDILDKPFKNQAGTVCNKTAQLSFFNQGKDEPSQQVELGFISADEIYKTLDNKEFPRFLQLDNCYVYNFSLSYYRQTRNIEENDIVKMPSIDANDAVFDTEGSIDFSYAEFIGENIIFERASFLNGKVNFEGARMPIGIKNFEYSLFHSGAVNFKKTLFRKGDVTFKNAIFNEGKKEFEKAVFEKGNISFLSVDFGAGDVSFSDCEFEEGDLLFKASIFGKGKRDFNRCKFGKGDIAFDRAQFADGDIIFRFASFEPGGFLNFTRAKFGKGKKHFTDMVFVDTKISMANVEFGDGDVDFSQTLFGNNDLEFRMSNFGAGNKLFKNAKFGDGKCDFEGVDFGSGKLNFYKTEFGNGEVSFEGTKLTEGKVMFKQNLMGAGSIDFIDIDMYHEDIEMTFDNVNFGSKKISFSQAKITKLVINTCYINSYCDLRVAKCDAIDLSDSIIRDILDLTPKDFKMNINTLDLSGVRLLGRMYINWNENNVKDFVHKQKTTFRNKAEQFRILKQNYNVIGRYNDEDEAYIEFKRCEALANLYDSIEAAKKAESGSLRKYSLLGAIGKMQTSEPIRKKIFEIVKQTDFKHVAPENTMDIFNRADVESVELKKEIIEAVNVTKLLESKETPGFIQKLSVQTKSFFSKLSQRVSYFFQLVIFDKVGLYATDPIRVLASMIVFYLGFSLTYYSLASLGWGSIYDGPPDAANIHLFFKSAYLSAITFFTIGFGDFYPMGALRILACLEGFAGVFMMSYFTVAFVRKILR